MRRWLAGPATLALLAALAGCGGAAPQARPDPHIGSSSGLTSSPAAALAYDVAGLRDPAAGKFLGVETPGAAGSLRLVTTFAASAGRRPDIIGQYVGWNSGFNADAAAAIWTYGALPFLVWEPYGTTLRAIAAGASDTYISSFARAVRSLNVPVAISFGHEMNGNWYPWGVTGGTAAQFVAAWRRIHRLFAAAGATNVIWVWNPNSIDALPQVQLKAYYPGDSEVDWVGITAYFTATTPDTFSGLFGPTIAEIRTFTAKPLIIPETSVASWPGALTAVASLFQALAQRQDVLGFVWFEYEKAGVDWRIESRPAIRAAFASRARQLNLVNVALARGP